MAASFPTPRPGHMVVWDDIYVDQYADNIDDLDTRAINHESRLTLLDPLATRAGCLLRRAANQSITTGGAAQSLSWDTEDSDPQAFASGATITIPTGFAGVYAITLFVAPAATVTTRAFAQIVTSGPTGVPAQFRLPIDLVNEKMVTITASVPLAVGNTVLGQVFHTTGSSQNFTGWMSCYRTSL